MPPVLNHLWPSASPPGQYAHPPSSATLNGLEGSTGGLRRCVLRMQMNWMRARSISHSLFSERETGLEPANLNFGKVALYQLSYSRVTLRFYSSFASQRAYPRSRAVFRR